MPQLEGLLKGTSLDLDDAVLDRIDEIVPPGLAVRPAFRPAGRGPGGRVFGDGW
jgi:hypothetical protein